MKNRHVYFCLGIAAGFLLKAACDNAGRRSETGTPEIRPAGRKLMREPPTDWDKVDEESDESFPASDPPGNY
ncbi:hypothetical protein A6J80_04460 [Paracoccus yeei]|uniref:Uncharacterized protein n=1 Tax=Paracoccus yeei TaxID=147645 RepID=A0A1V0GX63_9RHOB|nr:hypothetical protein [Paracoccus yeei]ARC38417.1 hypothetical protein A6J80_04460 [Paracoccus yeei]